MVLLVALSTATSVTYGSAVKLVELPSPNGMWYLHSLDVQWSGAPRDQNIVTMVQEETNPAIYWVLVPDGSSASGTPIQCGSQLRLQHAVTGKRLLSTMEKSMLSRDLGVVASGSGADVFTVECDSEVWAKGQRIALKHAQSGLYLKSSQLYTNGNCPRCPIVGQKEVTLGSPTYWAVDGGVIVHEIEKEKEIQKQDVRDEL